MLRKINENNYIVTYLSLVFYKFEASALGLCKSGDSALRDVRFGPNEVLIRFVNVFTVRSGISLLYFQGKDST